MNRYGQLAKTFGAMTTSSCAAMAMGTTAATAHDSRTARIGRNLNMTTFLPFVGTFPDNPGSKRTITFRPVPTSHGGLKAGRAWAEPCRRHPVAGPTFRHADSRECANPDNLVVTPEWRAHPVRRQRGRPTTRNGCYAGVSRL